MITNINSDSGNISKEPQPINLTSFVKQVTARTLAAISDRAAPHQAPSERELEVLRQQLDALGIKIPDNHAMCEFSAILLIY